MSCPSDLSIMDFLFTQDGRDVLDNKDFIKSEIDITPNPPVNFMDDDTDWPTNNDDFFEKIFCNDLAAGLDLLDFNIEQPIDQNLNVPITDSTGSDSGLDIDMTEDHQSPIIQEYEELSPAFSPATSMTMSSPGPSVSEVGRNSSPQHSSVVSSEPDSEIEYCYINESQIPILNVSQPSIVKQQAIMNSKSTSNTNKQNNSMKQKSVNLTTNNGVRKLIKLSSVSSNPRSILLPVSIKDMKELRTIKIINASGIKKTSAGIKMAAANLLQQGKQGLLKKNVVFTQQQLGLDDSHSDRGSNSEDESSIHYDQESSHDTDGGETTYPRLVLTSEEKRLLMKEGITLPSNYPLTKHEERELKRIRRKIRNKISAQDSRKRKKEYVDGLEDRVKQCTEENQTLMKRIKALQTQNQSLASQLRKLQNLMARGSGKAAQPATCLMVLLLSMALVAVPSLRPGGSSQQELAQQQAAQQEASQDVMATTRRTLLYSSKPQDVFGEEVIDDDLKMEDLLTFHRDHDYPLAKAVKRTRYEPIEAGPPRKRALMDLPVDDNWPPPKTKEEALSPAKSDIEYDYYISDEDLDEYPGYTYETLDDIGKLNIPKSPVEKILKVGEKIAEFLDMGSSQKNYGDKKITGQAQRLLNDKINASEINSARSVVMSGDIEK